MELIRPSLGLIVWALAFMITIIIGLFYLHRYLKTQQVKMRRLYIILIFVALVVICYIGFQIVMQNLLTQVEVYNE